MKLAAPSAVLFFVLSAVQAQIYDVNIPTPECVKFKTIKFKGNAEFVDTDGSGIPAPQTTGDMSIGEVYSGVFAPGYPNQPPFFGINLRFKSICVVTRDQPYVPNSSPTCFFEFDGGFCQKWKWFKYSSYPVKYFKANDKQLISANKIRRVLAKLGRNEDGANLSASDTGGVRGTPTEGDPWGEAGAEVAATELQDIATEPEVAATEPEERKGYVAAIQITPDFVSNVGIDALVKRICPQLYCWIPYYFRCRRGGFTAHGSGPDPFEITGGTRGFFGAFGQIITPTPFDIGSVNPITGDLTGSSIDMDLELCYYRKEKSPRIF